VLAPLALRGVAVWPQLVSFCSDLISNARDAVPAHLKTPQQMAVAVLRGLELGLPELMALNEITVVRGKTSLSAVAVGALLNMHGFKVDFPEQTRTAATCVITRPDGRFNRVRFTMEDAQNIYTVEYEGGQSKTIRLSEKGSYRQHPDVMLANRALTRNARRFCPEILAGVYSQDEIEDTAVGGVIDVTPPADTPPAAEPEAQVPPPAAAVGGVTDVTPPAPAKGTKARLKERLAVTSAEPTPTAPEPPAQGGLY
jgi:hypothetical protein